MSNEALRHQLVLAQAWAALVPVLVLVLVLAPGQATERALAPAMRRSLGPRLRTQAQTQLPSSSCRQKFANRALE